MMIGSFSFLVLAAFVIAFGAADDQTLPCFHFTVAGKGSYPVCDIFFEKPSGIMKVFYAFEFSLAYEPEGESYSDSKSPVTFPPVSTPWTLVAGPDANFRMGGGFGNPFPSIRIDAKYNNAIMNTYINCVPLAQYVPLKVRFNETWCSKNSVYCSHIPIERSLAPELCDMLSTVPFATLPPSTQRPSSPSLKPSLPKPSFVPSFTPSPIPCFSFTVSGYGSFPVCDAFINKATGTRLPFYAKNFTLLYDQAGIPNRFVSNHVTFPPLNTPWYLVTGPDLNDNTGGDFATPYPSIKIGATYVTNNNQKLVLYITCRKTVAPYSIGFKSAWCADKGISCAMLPILESSAPELCELLNSFTLRPTSAPSTLPTGIPSKRPSASPSKVPTKLPTRKPSCRPSFFPSFTRPSFIPSSKPSTLSSFKPSFRSSSIPSSAPKMSLSPSSMKPRTPPTFTPKTKAPSIRPSSTAPAVPVTSVSPSSRKPMTRPTYTPKTKAPTTRPSSPLSAVL